MAKVITYDVPNNRIDMTGGTVIDPITFADLWNADQGGGWGVVHDLGSNIYAFDAKLRVGDGFISTYFKDYNKVIVLTDNITPDYILDVCRYATLQLGQLLNAANKWTCNGCIIHIVRPSHFFPSLFNHLYGTSYASGTTLLYGCTITTLDSTIHAVSVNCRDTDRFWNCSLSNYCYFKCWGETDIYNVTLSGGVGSGSKPNEALWLSHVEAVPIINDVKFTGFQYAIRLGSNIDAEARNMVCLSNDRAVYLTVAVYTETIKLIDCVLTNWIVRGLQGNSGEVLRQYTVNIHIADKDGANLAGANVVCKDKDGNELFNVNTWESGNITEQEVTYQRWSDTVTDISGEDEATLFSPHQFIISKAGYETLTIENITLDTKINWHLELQDPVPAPADYPDIGDVEKGVVFDSGAKTGTFKAPIENNVRKPVHYGAGDVEFTGKAAVPAKADVRKDIDVDVADKGELDLPAVGDVEKDVKFDSLTKTGTFKRPLEADVREAVQYGKDDVEFTGTLVSLVEFVGEMIGYLEEEEEIMTGILEDEE